ncbi:GPW/gp25 family protein [Azospirillum sp. sgz302134]
MAGMDNAAILGTGWTFPPTFDRASASVLMSTGVEDIRESLWILLSTSLGERLMQPAFGSALWRSAFSGLTQTLATQIRDMVAQAILEWEPRIDVEGIAVTDLEPERGLIHIDVAFRVRLTNTRSNLVYPFCLLEATLPPPPP